VAFDPAIAVQGRSELTFDEVAGWPWFHHGINAMQSVRATTLIPRGFSADGAVNICDRTLGL
jgi:hypothetical protein